MNTRYNSALFKLLPIPKWVEAITLVNTIHFRHSVIDVDQNLVNHEMVHIKQISENGILKFYFLYMFYFFINLLKHGNFYTAYRNIPFELEAYNNEE